MTDGRPSILDITEEKIFGTLGRPKATICSLLSEVDRNLERSINAMDQISKQTIVPGVVTESLKTVRDSHMTNLEHVREAENVMNCS